MTNKNYSKVIISDNKKQHLYFINQNMDMLTQLKITQKKRGEFDELIIFIVLKNKDKINLETKTLHNIPKTTAYTYVRGVIFDNASLNHKGLIKIDRKANLTDAYLSCRFLLLGESAQVVSLPYLEIENNNVKASHGVSIGRIDKEQLYYLESRGLSSYQAQKLIIEGFFEDLLLKINSLKEREIMRKLIMNSLNLN